MNIEIIFTDNSELTLSARQLQFSIDERNRVRWQILPVGEQGNSIDFGKVEEAQAFVERYAVRLGFNNKIADYCLERGK